MKTSRISSGAADKPPAAAAKTDQDPNKSFSKVLEGRRGRDKSEREKLQKEENELPMSLQEKSLDEEAILKLLPLSDNSLAQVAQPSPQVSSAEPVSPKQPIQALVQEIWHSVSA